MTSLGGQNNVSKYKISGHLFNLHSMASEMGFCQVSLQCLGVIFQFHLQYGLGVVYKSHLHGWEASFTGSCPLPSPHGPTYACTKFCSSQSGIIILLCFYFVVEKMSHFKLLPLVAVLLITIYPIITRACSCLDTTFQEQYCEAEIGKNYRIKPEELYILSCGKGRGRRPRLLRM